MRSNETFSRPRIQVCSMKSSSTIAPGLTVKAPGQPGTATKSILRHTSRPAGCKSLMTECRKAVCETNSDFVLKRRSKMPTRGFTRGWKKQAKGSADESEYRRSVSSSASNQGEKGRRCLMNICDRRRQQEPTALRESLCDCRRGSTFHRRSPCLSRLLTRILRDFPTPANPAELKSSIKQRVSLMESRFIGTIG